MDVEEREEGKGKIWGVGVGKPTATQSKCGSC